MRPNFLSLRDGKRKRLFHESRQLSIDRGENELRMKHGRRRDDDAVEIEILDQPLPIVEDLAAMGNDGCGVRVAADDANKLGPVIFKNCADDIAAPVAHTNEAEPRCFTTHAALVPA